MANSAPSAEATEFDVFTDPRLKAARLRIASAIQEYLDMVAKRNPGMGLDDRMARLYLNADFVRTCGGSVACLRIGANGCEGVYRAQCRQLLCPVCGSIKAAKLRAGLRKVIEHLRTKGRRFTLMTLTLAHQLQDSLFSSVTVLFRALARLRHSALFKKHVRGWARSIEVTWSDGAGFHPHGHFILDAAFLDLDKLHRVWTRCVERAGGRPVARQGVDLKGIKNDGGLNEAIGYPFKVAEISTWPAGRLIGLVGAVRRRHLFQSCREWSRLVAHFDDEQRGLHAFEHDGVENIPMSRFLAEFREGDPHRIEQFPSVVDAVCRVPGLELEVERLREEYSQHAFPCSLDRLRDLRAG